MTQRRLIPLLLLLCLMLGQVLFLAHGIKHTLSDPGHQPCVLCLSSTHHYSLAASAPATWIAFRQIVPGIKTIGRTPSAFQRSYDSRAPPRLPCLSV